MHAEIPLHLSEEAVRAKPAHILLAELKIWLARTKLTALLHPHGFYVVLVSRTEEEEWRFHFWQREPRFVTGMPAFVHTHDRHVDSWILQGLLTNVVYEVTAVSAGGSPLYEVGYEGDRYRSSTSNVFRMTSSRVKVHVVSEAVMQSGDSYRVNRHDYHEAIVPQHLCTATLVRMHSAAPGPVRVVGLDGFPPTIAFQRSEVPADIFLDDVEP